MSAARELFRAYADGGVEHLKEAIATKRGEDLYLDFKEAEAPMRTEDRRSLAEAISGFANSDGGIIVWGVQAKSPAHNEPDVAQELRPIQKIALFLSQLHEFSSALVSPGVIGVEHALIPDPTTPDTGFAVTYVPASESGIHMAMAKDQHRYYYRSGASFRHMEAYMVADRFGRRPRPKLEFAYCIRETETFSGSGGHGTFVVLYLGVRNRGTGVARFPALAVYQTEELPLTDGIDGNGRPGLRERPRNTLHADDRWRFFAGGLTMWFSQACFFGL